jgi:hypothetical protein
MELKRDNSNRSSWEQFCEDAYHVMNNTLANKITVQEAVSFFERAAALTVEALREDLENTIFEIDGRREMYQKVLGMFEAGATEEQFVKYFNSLD